MGKTQEVTIMRHITIKVLTLMVLVLCARPASGLVVCGASSWDYGVLGSIRSSSSLPIQWFSPSILAVCHNRVLRQTTTGGCLETMVRAEQVPREVRAACARVVAGLLTICGTSL